MQYLITFLEGVSSFISPCMLPMLPLYLSYFAGGEEKKGKTLRNAAAFTAGFTLVFCLLGLLSGTLGAFLARWQRAVNLVCGAVVILLGLSYLDVIPLKFLKGMQRGRAVNGLVSAFVFGLVYAVSLTPCIGAFLGAALMLAASGGGALRGTLLLLVYSLGLGLPFLLSALLLDRLKGAFDWIKRHYRQINTVCGALLILLGALMMTGLLQNLFAMLA